VTNTVFGSSTATMGPKYTRAEPADASGGLTRRFHGGVGLWRCGNTEKCS